VINSAAPPEFKSIAHRTEPPPANSLTGSDQIDQRSVVVDDPSGQHPLTVGVDRYAVMCGFARIDAGPQDRCATSSSVVVLMLALPNDRAVTSLPSGQLATASPNFFREVARLNRDPHPEEPSNLDSSP
jgi:hypothetical protein